MKSTRNLLEIFKKNSLLEFRLLKIFQKSLCMRFFFSSMFKKKFQLKIFLKKSLIKNIFFQNLYIFKISTNRNMLKK